MNAEVVRREERLLHDLLDSHEYVMRIRRVPVGNAYMTLSWEMVDGYYCRCGKRRPLRLNLSARQQIEWGLAYIRERYGPLSDLSKTHRTRWTV